MEWDPELEEARVAVLKRILREASLSRCCSRGRGGLVEAGPGEFEDLVSSCRAALAFFYSPTCPYCRMMEPIIEEAARVYGDRVLFVRVNVAAQPDVAWRYAVMGTPTLIGFRRGREAARLVGLQDPETVEELILALLEAEGCPLPAPVTS